VDPQEKEGFALKNKSFIFGIFFCILIVTSLFAPQILAVDWNKQSILSSKHNVGQWTSLALDFTGSPHVSYTDPENGDLKYAEWDVRGYDPWNSNENNGWLVKETVEEGVFSAGTSLKLDSAGNPHISYYKALTQQLKYASWDGSKWIMQIVDSNGNVGQYSSLALDPTGKPCISYLDAKGHALKYAQWTGNQWKIDIVDTKSQVGMFTSLVLDSAGNPCISYYDNSNDYLKYANIVNGRWTTYIPDLKGTGGQYTSLKLNSAGFPCISYYAPATGDLKYAVARAGDKKNPLMWTIETVDSIADVGKYSSLSLSSKGNPCISYYDATETRLLYSMKTGSGWSKTYVDAPNVGEFSSLALVSDDKPQITYYDRGNGALKRAYVPTDSTDSFGTSFFEDNFDNPRVSSPTVPANDVTQMFVYASNGKVYNFGVLYSNPPTWVATVDPYDPAGNSIVPAPIVTVGTVYVTSTTGKLYALNRTTGEIIWVFSTGQNEGLSLPNIQTTLGIIVFISETGKVYCLNTADRTIKWTRDIESSFPITTLGRAIPNVNVNYGLVFVPTQTGSIYAINVADGSVRWVYSTGENTAFPIPIAIFGDALVDGSANGKLYAIRVADGSLKWMYNTGENAKIVYSPISGVAIATSANGKLYAINGADGILKWVYSPPNGDKITVSNPAFAAGLVYVGSEGGYVYAINFADGNLNWVYSTGGSTLPYNILFLDGVIYAGSADGTVHALNAGTGIRNWYYKTNDNTAPSVFRVFSFADFYFTVFSGLSTGKIYSLYGMGKERFVNLITDNVWDVDYPSWAIQNGKLTPTAFSASGFDARPTILTKQYFYDKFNLNLNIEAKYTRTSSTGISAGIIFKCLPNQYFDFETKLPKTYLGVFLLNSAINFGKVVDGVLDQTSVRSVAYPFELNKEYTLRVEIYGLRIDVYVDGILTASDTGISLGYPQPWGGHVGFNINGAHVTFDDVKISMRMQSETVDSGNLGQPILRLDSNNSPNIVIADPSRGYLLYSRKTSSGWITEIAAKGRYANGPLSFALDSSGNPYIVHQQLSTGKLLYTTKKANVWQTETIVQLPVGTSKFNPSLAVDANGKPHLSYFDYHMNNLKYATKPVNQWVITTVDPNGGSGSLVLDSNGAPHVAYNYGLTPLVYGWLEPDGWHKEEIGTSYYFSMGATLALDQNDQPHIVYNDPWNLYLGYATKTESSSTWTINEFAEGVTPWTQWSFALDVYGKPYVCYYAALDSNLKLARWTGIEWTTLAFDLGSISGIPSIVLDPTNTLNACYIDSTSHQIAYATSSLP
jgi:outer membrane protein assembly factor BamB